LLPLIGPGFGDHDPSPDATPILTVPVMLVAKPAHGSRIRSDAPTGIDKKSSENYVRDAGLLKLDELNLRVLHMHGSKKATR